MRILMVTDTYKPARNGVAMWVALSVRELRARGHEVDVLTYGHDRRDPAEPGVIELPAWVGLDPDFKVAPVVSGLPVALEGKDWDIVHVHHPILLGPRGVDLGRSRGSKVVFTCHSVYTDYLDEYYWGIGRFLKPQVNRGTARLVNRCDLAFAPSARVVEWLHEIGVGSRVETLEAPADTQRIRCITRAAARDALGLGDEPIAMYVGRIADEKRVEVLLDEFAVALRSVPDARIVLAGNGRRYGAVEHKIARGPLAGHARLLGAVNGEDLAWWYSAADISVSASRSETGPLTVVEAMACGTPTVSLRAPGFVDRIEDGVNGLLAEDVPGALGEAMARVLGEETLRARLAAGAVVRALRYTPAAVTDRMVEMYEDLLA